MKKNNQLVDEQSPIEFDVSPVNLNGKLTYRIFAKSGDIIVHNDTFNIADAERRQKFTRRLGERAKKKNIEFDADGCDQAILDLAYQSALDLDTQGGDQSGERESVDPAEVLTAFSIDLLGEQEDQSIVLWCRSTRKRFVVKNPGRWFPQEMRQALGATGDNLLWTIPDTPPPEGKYTPFDLQRAVALAASAAPRISSGRLIGQGIWQKDGEFLVVNGAKAHVFRQGSFLRVSQPRFKNEIIDFSDSKAWTDQQLLLKNTKEMTAKKAKSIMRQIEQLLSQWNWTHKWDHRIAASLIPATFIQSCWSWRPLVSIIGASDTGKTTLLGDVLLPLFGKWTVFADRSSEAGLRQAIRHNTAPVMIDEFDKYKQRQQVLELFRTSSRGGKILRGTANQEGQEFGVKHLAWFAAIESGDIWGQDRNRFIRLELLPPENRGCLVLPSNKELSDLRQELIAVALWAAPVVTKLADTIKGTQVDGVHGRLVESFSVPAAMDAVVRFGHGVPEKNATNALRAFLKNRASLEEQGEPDEVRLLRDILAATIRVQLREKDRTELATRTISQILEGWTPFVPDAEQHLVLELEARGVRIVQLRDGAGSSLFLVSEMVREKLLHGSRWQQTRIDQILKRLPGAQSTQQRCAGQRPWGISLPWPGCLESIDGEDNDQDNATP
jgi:hypothetical protein